MSDIKRYIPVKGDSMWPWLLPGDQILCCYDDLPPRRGDIVLSRLDGRMIVHRVVSTNPVRLKGDRSIVADPPGLPVLGRVVGMRRGKKIAHWGNRTPPGGKIAVVMQRLTAIGESGLWWRRLARWFALTTYWVIAKRRGLQGQ